VSGTATTGVNVLLKSAPTAVITADLNTIGTVLDLIPQLNAVLMRASAADLAAIRAKPYVASAEMDRQKTAPPMPSAVAWTDFIAGQSTWNLDAVNVTVAPGFTGRNPDLKGLTGKGVYVGVLDSGLIPEWRSLFPAERIDIAHAREFAGGGGEKGTVTSRPDRWEGDVVGHGTAVTSYILGYSYAGVSWTHGPVNGVAPGATVIPVKVLNQNNSGNVSAVVRGIVYVADLKAGPLAAYPVVINYSIGSDEPYPLENAAFDYAISKGVIVVVSAGNQGAAGMSWPGAYGPVISVAATGWIHQHEACGGPPVYAAWWAACDVPEPTSANDFYLTEFSSRQLAGQQLDLAAPGVLLVTPFPNRGGVAYSSALGTSFAAPHVTGVAALMAEKKPTLRQAEAEAILQNTAIPIPPGSRSIYDLDAGSYVPVTWGADATGAGMLDAVAAVKATR
jgi:subtilisin family serine protease